MADSALREKGRKMRRKLLGDAAVERIDKSRIQRSDHGEVRRSHPGIHLRRIVDPARPGSENPCADLRYFRRRHRPRPRS